MDLTDPTTAALLVLDAFERTGLDAALYGGLLTAAYGEPRETRDADVAVLDVSVEQARAALGALGIDTTPGFSDVRFGGLTVSRIALERALEAPLRGRQVRVLCPEDFVIFKLLSTRDRDLEDAVGVMRRFTSALDRVLIESEARVLMNEIEDFDVLARLDKALESIQGPD